MPEEELDLLIDSYELSTTVQFTQEQFQTFNNLSAYVDMLLNRLEVMLLLFIVLITLFIYQLIRGKAND